VSIVIPVYNEAPYVTAVLDAVRGAALPPGVRREIVCVNDGSSDGTRAILDAYGEGIVVHHSPVNGGKGTAIRLALERVTGDVVVIQDADLEYDPADYTALVTPILEGRATVVYGSRFLGSCEGMQWPNRTVNRVLAWLVRVLYRQAITDEATCYKAFRADVAREAPRGAPRESCRSSQQMHGCILLDHLVMTTGAGRRGFGGPAGVAFSEKVAFLPVFARFLADGAVEAVANRGDEMGNLERHPI
jgi:glycosyltransferase involved in cell wall biosynthesis